MANSLAHWVSSLMRHAPYAETGPPPPPSPPEPPPPDFEQSTTVFTGEREAWVNYLRQPWARRFDGYYAMELSLDRSRLERLTFSAQNSRSKVAADILQESWRIFYERLTHKPSVLDVLRTLLLDNAQNFATPLRVFSHEGLPAQVTRECSFASEGEPLETRIVVNTGALQSVEAAIHRSPKPLSDLDLLGLAWPCFGRILLQLGQRSYPRDRFIERIHATTRWVLLCLHALYDGRESGALAPNAAGQRFADTLALAEGIPRQHVSVRHPFLRLLESASFLLNERGLDSTLPAAAILVRDYLDARYLRLSISGLMPTRDPWLTPVPHRWKGRECIEAAKPEIGRYGILDDEDLSAWRKVRPGLADLGYFIIAQLGMGQFGRVYEAVNVHNPAFPPRVAVKVDRFRKGHKREAIELAENIMATAAGLATSPHVIRVFDAGKLKRARATYHVLQLVEGDTLDNLIGITGLEHSSILRPKGARSSAAEARREFLDSIHSSQSEQWRRARRSSPFRRAPSLNHLLDLLVSKMLWVEEVHGLGYAVNDLKNGNVMINRRGQLKAIDLDAYAPAFSAFDKLPDFFFLAVSALQLILGANREDAPPTAAGLGTLLSESGAIESHLTQIWPYGDLASATHGRVGTPDVIDFFTGFIGDAKGGRFAEHPTRFSTAIDRMISIKRSLTNEEMVLE